MAEGQSCLRFSSNEKDLEEGEIDDLEEGEIDEFFEEVSEDRFSARQEKSGSENDLQTRHHNSQSKSENLTHNQRNSFRNTKYTRDRDERRTDTYSSRSYERTGRNRAGVKQNFAGKRRDELLRGDSKYRTRETASWGNQEFDSYMSNYDNNYPHKTSGQPTLSSEYTDGPNNEDEDFKSLLQQYKHIQEQLDGLGHRPKHRSLVDDVIDDSFVDVPLDDHDDGKNSEKPQDDLDAEIRKLELDFSHTSSINTELNSGNPVHSDYTKYLQSIPTISQTIPTTYENDEHNYDNYTNEQPFFGIFEPFKIKPAAPKKVRTLSELNQIDLASRGLISDNNGQSKVTNGRTKPKGKNKARRRPNKGVRQRMKRKAADRSGSKVSSSDVYQELGIGIKKTQTEGSNGTIIIKKQKLREWQQGKGNMMLHGDDYIQTPMEVETDSTESFGIIEESQPLLPPIDLPEPPPPGEEMGISSTSHIMPLMDVKPYGYFHDYGSPWWGGPGLPHVTESYSAEQSATMHKVSPTLQEKTEIRPSENNTTQTFEQNSFNLMQQADLEVDDEASELALREQLLKSMVTKRAAKNAGKGNEKNFASSVVSPNNSRATSPFPEPSVRKAMQEVVKNETIKAAKVNIAPPKHEPVVIHLGADSDDSESEGESPIKQTSNSFFGGLDSFIKEARERSSKSKSEVKTQMEDTTQPPTPTTPEVVSVLSEEKRNEYKKLKQQLALKEQQKGLDRKENVYNGSVVKKNENVATKQAQEKNQFEKRQAQKEKQKLPTSSFNRQTEIERQVQEQHQQKLLQLQKQQQQQKAQQEQERQQQEQKRQQQEQKRQQQEQQKQIQQQQKYQQQIQQQKQDETNEQQQQANAIQPDANSGSNHELKLKLKILSEMLLGHKRLIMQDQRLLESCEDQLDSSSKALEEHQSRVSLLQQQLQRAERLKKVQQDLVEKLKIQNIKLNQRMSKRQSDAREVEERLFRTRALLVAQQSPRTSVTTGKKSLPQLKPRVASPEYQNPAIMATGGKFLGEVKPTELKPGQDSQDGGINSAQSSSKAFNEVGEKFREMSRILEESVPNEKELNSAPSRKNDEDSTSMSNTPSKTLTEDKQIQEKKRLRILEQRLSQRLRQSNARRQIGKESESIRKEIGKKTGSSSLQLRDERASSDSELIVRRNTSPRGFTPPVELMGGSDLDEDDGGLRTELMMDIFKSNDKLEKVKRIQTERETSGPSFIRVCNNVALPARFTSTKCAWLEHISLSKHLDDIAGCLSAVVAQAPSATRSQAIEQKHRRATGPYRSPLVYFRSYRFSPYYRTKKGFTLDSHSFTHLVNPRVPFCPFALQGICSDPECPHQHPDDVIPKDKQILEDLAAYFAAAGKKVSDDNDVIKSITRTIDAVTKQYGDKVSPAELRVLFVNYLRKQKSAGIFNIVLERRSWRPISHTKKDPGTNAPVDEYPVIETENTFSWKSWRRKIENEIKTRSVDRDECQEIRYFSENYDSIKTLEKGTRENPSDESLWIRLAMVHMGSNTTEEDKNNNSRKNMDKALNTLAQALEYNRHSEKLWLKYLDVFRQRATTDELYEVCEEAVELAGSYNVWWTYLEIASDYERKTNVCLKCIEFLILSDTEVGLKSHRLLEIFLYLMQLDLQCDFYKVALDRFRVALNCVDGSRDTREILASLAENTICEDLCLLWLSYIHLVEFSCLPREFYDPARTGPARIVRKDGVVLPWKPAGGTRHGFAELLKLFHRGLKECAAVLKSPDKVSPVFWLYKNLIALERASGKDASSIRTCQRLLKASPKKIELWLCMSALQQVSGNEGGAVNVYKKALETCDGHAQIAYCAAKYFIETENREECYEALVTCVYSKFILEVPSARPKTRARSHDQPTILRPNPELLYNKLLSQTLPLDSIVPSAKPGVQPGNMGTEGTYIWLCYCMFIELFSDDEPTERHSVTQAAYECAVYSTGDRHEVKILWIEYLYYMARRLKEKLCKSEELHDIFHKCLTTVPAVTPVLYISSRSWSDYNFHNEVLGLYRRCLGDAFSSNVYDKYLEMFPDNSILAIQ